MYLLYFPPAGPIAIEDAPRGMSVIDEEMAGPDATTGTGTAPPNPPGRLTPPGVGGVVRREGSGRPPGRGVRFAGDGTVGSAPLSGNGGNVEGAGDGVNALMSHPPISIPIFAGCGTGRASAIFEVPPVIASTHPIST